MPVRTFDAAGTGIDPYRRLSASQTNLWTSCPRKWFYAYRHGLKGPMPPVIIRGNAAEACLSRIMQESPVLIAPDSTTLLTSPLTADKDPDYDDTTNWLAQRLDARPEGDWPDSREALETWALARLDFHFDACWEAAVHNWKITKNRSGSIEDADEDECRVMIAAGIRMHLDEVEGCLEANGGPMLEAWRAGEARPDSPAPDGFPLIWNTPHKAARSSGEVTWCEAWELARPWFVDPDAGQFKQATCHPDGWFQGEYDMIYRWNGNIRIIDIKASIGKGDRSGDYIEQLRLYAWLWWETHDHTEDVEGLEVWYLGTGTVKVIRKPTESELKGYEKELKELYQKLRAGDPSEADCPTNPAPLRIFEEGGKAADPPTDPDPNARCIRCDYRGLCENVEHDLDLPLERRIERFGHAWPITPFAEIVSRVDAVGNVGLLRGPEFDEKGVITFRFDLKEGYDKAVVKPNYGKNPTNISRAIANGARVRVKNAIPGIWRGNIELLLDEESEVVITDDEDEAPIVEIVTQVNVVGRVWSIDAIPNGVDVKRWAVTLLDQSGVCSVVAFRGSIPITAASVERGDEVAILNGTIGEFGGRAQVKLSPSSKVVHLRANDELPAF